MIKKILLGIVIFFSAVTILGFIVGGSDSETAEKKEEAVPVAQPEAQKEEPAQPAPEAEATAADKKAAQEKLDALMQISKTTGLVTSYEFTDLQNVVYVTDLWYKLDVTTKKNFLSNVGTLKEITTGYHRFEVRHAQSNEKVGEVTAFSGSLEVYK